MTPELLRLLITAAIAGACAGAVPVVIAMALAGGYSRVPTPPLPPRRALPLREGMVRKGGINPDPFQSVPVRPDPPAPMIIGGHRGPPAASGSAPTNMPSGMGSGRR